jgi:hypothetical protein
MSKSVGCQRMNVISCVVSKLGRQRDERDEGGREREWVGGGV